jgi:hypothetical protein
MAPSKPKRKSVESTFADKWEPENKGDELCGKYIGSETAPGRKQGETFTAYHIMDDEGKRWSVAGAHLDSILNQVPRDTYVWITFDGTQTVKNGEMAKYRVDVEEGVQLVDPYEKKTAPKS